MTKRLLLLLPLLISSIYADEIDIFDGKTLDGWKGDRSFWSVQDGTITGKSTADNPCKATTYLTYTKKEFSDFELTVKFRFLTKEGNSGIQYRSQWHDQKKFQIKGYQADLETGTSYSGILYEQNGRGIVAKRGQQIKILPNGKKEILPKPLASAAKAQASIKSGEWNTYHIIAEGSTLTHQINGHTSVIVKDNDSKQMATKGLLALQLHQGPSMTVQYKDLEVLELDHDTATPSTKSTNLKTLPGFSIEKIHTVNKSKEGSWVSMCFDDYGYLYVCDQYGKLFKITLKDGRIQDKKVIPGVGNAQGLCAAYGSLYLATQSKGTSGIQRLTDSNDDGNFDKIELIYTLNSGGEHGPHGIIKAPDGQNLLLVLGNKVQSVRNTPSVSTPPYAEDTLLPHHKDPNGHALNIKAPGGTVVRISPDGKKKEIVATGMRNTYDLAASPSGEVFAYDSDMEWDVGTPWYRPTRVLHITEGAEFGWRTGTSKWPEYYADSLGSVIDIGPGSPTGLTFGTGAKFPAKYQKALYALDWTFGRIYALHLTPEGASYRTTKETFLSGKPLPLSDAVVSPDGDLYVTTGGRRLQSDLYRITYTGKESTAPVTKPQPSPGQTARRALEKSRDLSQIWPALGNTDRTHRFAARFALEHLPADQWLAKFKAESDPQTIITSSLALSRLKGNSNQIAEKLLQINFAKLNQAQQLEYLRALSLSFIRSGKPSPETQAAALQKLDPLYPNQAPFLNRELCRLLVYLDSKQVLTKTTFLIDSSLGIKEDLSSELLDASDKYGGAFKEMLKNYPDPQALHYALMLKNVKSGWTPDTVTSYYQWLAKAELKSGGNSYKGFIKNIRKEALGNLTGKLKALAVASSKIDKASVVNSYSIQGPGKNWTLEEAHQAVADLSKANAENGKKIFTATLCARCHEHSGNGGAAGPNLTNLSTRFTKKDILQAIIDPSEVISDQYATTQLELKNGSIISGKIMKEDATHLHLATSAFDHSIQTPIAKADVLKSSPSKTSTMPPSLINALNPDELRDLLLFLSNSPAP